MVEVLLIEFFNVVLQNIHPWASAFNKVPVTQFRHVFYFYPREQ